MIIIARYERSTSDADEDSNLLRYNNVSTDVTTILKELTVLDSWLLLKLVVANVSKCPPPPCLGSNTL
jgi:hypothetical protein